MTKRTRGWVLGGALAAVVALLLAVSAFACTVLPSITLSQPYAAAGASLQLTGTAWRAGMGLVSVRWDSASGPLLAQASVNADGTLSPVTVTIPDSASAAFHVIETTLPGGSGVVARAVVQVVGGHGATAPMPVAQLPGATTANASSIGAGTLAMLAALGATSMALIGAGTAFWVRSALRVPVPRTVRRR